MEKLDNQTSVLPEELKLKGVLFGIKQYAKDYSLTAAQIQDIFAAGIIANFRAGKIQIPSYTDDELARMTIENLKKSNQEEGMSI